MLNFMRRNANSWIMVLLFGIIIFVFAINFGPWAGNVAPSVPYAVVVNNEPISLAEFRTAYASQFARIKQFRPEYDQTQADRDGLKQVVVDQLVSRELLTQLGRKNNLKIAPLTLAQEIKERVFGEEAEFNKEEYIRRVNAFFQSTIAQFESQVEKELVAEQMANLLGTAVFVSDAEAKLAYMDKNSKIALEFIRVSPQHFVATTPNPADVKKFADAEGEKISTYYNEHISEYVKDEQVRASHILVKFNQGASANEKKAAKDKAQKLLERVKTNNEDFAAIAQVESDDIGTREKGGDLGLFSAGMMVEEFSKAAFALKPGEISDLVESPFGYHVIKQTEQKPKVERKLDDVKVEIAELLLKKQEQDKKAQEFASNALGQLKTGTALSAISLPGLNNTKAAIKQAAASPTAPVADETDPFSRSSGYIFKIGRAEKINEEAFKLSMDKKVPDQVIEANGDFYAIRLKSREDADTAQFETQKESIKMGLIYPRRRAFMQQYLTQLKSASKITYNDALITAKTMDG